MSKCWYCNNELTSGDNPKHFGICNKCYDEMFKSGDIIIRSFTNKIAELQKQLEDKEKEHELLINDFEEETEKLRKQIKQESDARERFVKKVEELKRQLAEKDKEIEKLTEELDDKNFCKDFEDLDICSLNCRTMQLEIPGYIVYNKTSNYYLGQNILGNNFYFYCNEEEKKYNKKIAPKIFYDTQGAMRALKYDNRHHEEDEYEIKQVSLHYTIEE